MITETWPASVRRIHLDEVDSTNRYAAREIEAGAPLPFLVVADRQTGGRGRLGRSWFSPQGGLYLTLALKPLGDSPFPYYPLILSLSAAEALRARGVEAGLKWPNDLVVEGSKIAGLLAEAAGGGAAIALGIGINVNNEVECAGRLPEAASLAGLTGRSDWDIGAMLDEIMASFARHLGLMKKEGTAGLRRLAEESSATLGRRVRIISAGRERTGLAVALADDLSLVLEGEGGRFSVVVGDCELLRDEGEPTSRPWKDLCP